VARAQHGDDAPAAAEPREAAIGNRSAVLFSCSLTGTVLTAGAAFGRLTGRPLSEFPGGPARALLQPWSHGELQHVLRSARDGLASGSTTLRFACADGSGVEVTAAWAVQAGTGTEAARLVFAHAGTVDVSARSGCLDVAVVLDAHGTLTYVSPVVSELFGYEVDDLTGIDVWHLLPAEDAVSAREAFRSVLDSRSPRTAVLRVRAARGDWRWIKIVAVNRLSDTVGGVVCAVHDITSEVAADRATDPAARVSGSGLRVVPDDSEEGIWAVSTTGATLFANPQMAAILGLSPDQLHDLELVSGIDPTAAADVLRRLGTRAERGPERYEISYAHPDGRERRLWVTATPLRAEDGSHEGSLAMVTDITEVRSAEEWLRAASPRTPPRSRPL
jgi:PAS domain S-box-containing protein